MMNSKRMMPLLLGVATLTMALSSQAGSPVWTFTPLTPTTLSVPANASATIQYRVTNQSPVPHTLMMVPMNGITQITTAGNCANPFSLSSGNPSCTLTLVISGSALNADVNGGPKVCQQGPDGNPSPLQCYQPGQSNTLSITLAPPLDLSTTISASITSLALQTSGLARKITITNTGTLTANSVTYNPSPTLPNGTSISPINCGNIAPAGTCELTITPGPTPSAATYDTNPTPITLSVQGTNTNTLTPTLDIVTYASVYQSGFIYSIDDTPPITRSIKGTVAALTDQAFFPNGIIWSSDGSGTTVSNIPIFGIAESSTDLSPIPAIGGIAGQLACNGRTDGECNTNNIVTYYNANRAVGGPPAETPLTQYASGLCKANIGGFTDWYLPAICQMGPSPMNGPGCLSGTPNMVDNLPSLLSASCTGTSCINDFFWSSTQVTGTSGVAWFQSFSPGGTSNQFQGSKSGPYSVRCSRDFNHLVL